MQLVVNKSAVVPVNAHVNQGQNQLRARAVRLLREAAAFASPSAPSDVSASAQSTGEVAFAVERAAMETFGAGQPRYFEFVTRFASKLKVIYDLQYICAYLCAIYM